MGSIAAMSLWTTEGGRAKCGNTPTVLRENQTCVDGVAPSYAQRRDSGIEFGNCACANRSSRSSPVIRTGDALGRQGSDRGAGMTESMDYIGDGERVPSCAL